MTNAKAIEILREKINEEFSTDTAEAFCMAISALEKHEGRNGKWRMLAYDEAVCECCGYNRNTPFYSTQEAKEHWNDLPPLMKIAL